MFLDITNADRADAAMAAVQAFRETELPEGILEQDIRDLITNLCHLYRRECIGKPSETEPSKTISEVLTRCEHMHEMEVNEDAEG